jgi:hypothetical protein
MFSLSPYWRNTEWGRSTKQCWGDYLEMRETVKRDAENCITRMFSMIRSRWICRTGQVKRIGEMRGACLITAERLMWTTVAVRCDACTLFVRSNTGIVGLNPTQGMDVCERLFCVCAILQRADPPSKESYRLCKSSRNWKSGQGPTNRCRTNDS